MAAERLVAIAFHETEVGIIYVFRAALNVAFTAEDASPSSPSSS